MPGRAKAVGNYNSRLAGIQAKVDGYDTALLLNRAGKIAEGPSMCFFMVRNGVPVTPSITSDILESITRDNITLLRDELGLETEEREIDRSELFMAEEAFFCGTGWEVTPVIDVDGAPIGNGEVGPIVKRLQQAYLDIGRCARRCARLAHGGGDISDECSQSAYCLYEWRIRAGERSEDSVPRPGC